MPSIKNTGQFPMYLIQNNHPAIVSREIYQAVQAEKTRRSASASPSKRTSSTGRSCYASKFALSERLVCGECGTLYRRCTWKRNGKARVVWRCVSRLDYGPKYCHQSPTMDEEPLQVPLGALMGSKMLSQTGPCADVVIKPVSVISTDFRTEFDSKAINQTKYKIYIVLKCRVKVMAPFSSRTFDTSSKILLAETVILGDVPDSFVQVPKDDILDVTE